MNGFGYLILCSYLFQSISMWHGKLCLMFVRITFLQINLRQIPYFFWNFWLFRQSLFKQIRTHERNDLFLENVEFIMVVSHHVVRCVFIIMIFGNFVVVAQTQFMLCDILDRFIQTTFGRKAQKLCIFFFRTPN